MADPITLPLTQEQVQVVALAAHAFGVEPWEMAVHALALRQSLAPQNRSSAFPSVGERTEP